KRDLPLADGERQELAPPPLRLTSEASRAWRALHDAIEAGMAPGARFASVKAWASKSPEQCLRIAGVLTLLEAPTATVIESATIERASELELRLLNEAARHAGPADLSPDTRDAVALLAWTYQTIRTSLYSAAAHRLVPDRIRDRS